MASYNLPLASTIILLLPMLYFLIASPAFLFVGLDEPIITRLLRWQFSVPFALVSLTCAIAAMAFVLAGRPIVGMATGSIAALSIGVRRWLLQRMDAEIRARDAGDVRALRRLRRLHWGAMGYNAIQSAAVVGSIPFVFAASP